MAPLLFQGDEISRRFVELCEFRCLHLTFVVFDALEGSRAGESRDCLADLEDPIATCLRHFGRIVLGCERVDLAGKMTHHSNAPALKSGLNTLQSECMDRLVWKEPLWRLRNLSTPMRHSIV